MKKRSTAAASLLGLAFVAAAPAQAQTVAAAATPDFVFTGNAGVFSDYRFRGFTQTGYKPAFQGGFDVSHVSGLYAGNWNSNVEQNLYRGASLEMDFYGGYKYPFAGDFTLDVGGIYYYYPTKRTRSTGDYAGYSKKAENGEIYVGVAWKTYSIKYYYGVTNFFGLGDSFQGGPEVDTNGSGYLDLSGSYDLGDGWGIIAHYGLQTVEKADRFTDIEGNTLSKNVSDYKIGVTKDIQGWVFGGAVVGTSKKEYFGTATSGEAGGKTRFVVSLSKTF